MSKIRKLIAILLVVLFLFTVTSSAVSAMFKDTDGKTNPHTTAMSLSAGGTNQRIPVEDAKAIAASSKSFSDVKSTNSPTSY
jgi:hypothetical protein